VTCNLQRRKADASIQKYKINIPPSKKMQLNKADLPFIQGSPSSLEKLHPSSKTLY
jgi:hypothetical protein